VNMRRLQVELHPDFVHTSYSAHQLYRSTQVSASVFTKSHTRLHNVHCRRKATDVFRLYVPHEHNSCTLLIPQEQKYLIHVCI